MLSSDVGPSEVRSRPIDRHAYAHDASHFRLVPERVVAPRSVEDVQRVMAATKGAAGSLTFRAAGTSLSGQAQSSGTVVDTRRHFQDVRVLQEGRAIRVQPGVTLRVANAHLRRYGYQLGPDPASEAACTIGGVIANNSSGMTCGTTANAYRTIELLVVVLAGGTVIDTADPGADETLRGIEPALHVGLGTLRDRIRGNPDLVRRIERLFAMKNTMGYGVNAFLDFDDPIDILSHLVVGSEGTLAFVAEATMRTIPIQAHAATAFLHFASVEHAASSVAALAASGAAAIELLDTTSLAVARMDPEAAASLPPQQGAAEAGLLVEYRDRTEPGRDAQAANAMRVFERLPLAARPSVLTSGAARDALWHVRKGLYASVASRRPVGTTALLEDIAVPSAELADTCRALTRLLDRSGYQGSVIFGHAREGNLHFLVNERFEQGRASPRYRTFTSELVDLVLEHSGTLKAEHGTGRMMAPYVERQYGSELYAVMREIKHLFDPDAILSPGVVISDDHEIHLRDLKATPAIDPEVDACVECGYCEPVCPSRDLTLTPRQRIAVRREAAHARAAGDDELADDLDRAFEYDGSRRVLPMACARRHAQSGSTRGR